MFPAAGGVPRPFHARKSTMKSYPDLYAESPRAFLRKLEADIKGIEARLAKLDKLATGSIGDLLSEYERLSLVVEQQAYGAAEMPAWEWTPRGGARVANLYPTEMLGDGRAFRWTGPEPVTEFIAPVERSAALTLRVTFMKTFDAAMLDTLEVAIDGVRIKHLLVEDTIVATVAPRTPLVAQATRVSISTGATAAPGETDTRRLGIALFSVELAPAVTEAADE